MAGTPAGVPQTSSLVTDVLAYAASHNRAAVVAMGAAGVPPPVTTPCSPPPVSDLVRDVLAYAASQRAVMARTVCTSVSAPAPAAAQPSSLVSDVLAYARAEADRVAAAEFATAKAAYAEGVARVRLLERAGRSLDALELSRTLTPPPVCPPPVSRTLSPPAARPVATTRTEPRAPRASAAGVHPACALDDWRSLVAAADDPSSVTTTSPVHVILEGMRDLNPGARRARAVAVVAAARLVPFMTIEMIAAFLGCPQSELRALGPAFVAAGAIRIDLKAFSALVTGLRWLLCSLQSARSELMQLVHQRLLALPAFVALRRRHVIGHIFGDANIMADAASRGNYVVAKELAAQLGMALQWKPHGPLLAALMRDLVTLHARATPPNTALAQTTRGASNLNMVGSPIAHLSRAPCPLGRPAPRLTACRQRTAGRHPLSAPPCTALAQTAHGMSNPNMVGSPFAHLSGTLDTSDLKTELSSPSWNHEMALSDAAPLLPYEPPWCQPAANCPASFQLAPAPPVIFPPASVAIPSVTPVASRPAADCTAGCAVAQLLTSDTSALALRPTSYNLEQLCLQLYDPTSAQPARTSNGQNSAWKHWAAWQARRSGL
ncbi:hypothetical protein AB1Y20_009305 [Prymnesium parvum]